jgi:hypothetical protein
MRWFLILPLVFFITTCTVNRSQQGETDIASGMDSTAGTPYPDLSNAPDAAIDAQGAIPTNEAIIEAAEIVLMESFPVQASVVIKGWLPDTCAVVDQINQAKNGSQFNIVVTTVHQTGVMCTEQPQLFEEVVPLDILGATAGEYSVTVTGANSVSNSFALTVDNLAPQPPPSPAVGAASITGIVWNDSCPVDSDSNCIADGLLNPAEARIPGVEVTLFQGACPGDGESVAVEKTDSSGTYLFSGLQITNYCISIDSTSAANVAVLSTGTWSYPGVGVGYITIQLADNDYQAVDFGWDYQSVNRQEDSDSELTTVEPLDCTNVAAYVADVTVPDDTAVSPGEPFVKTWRIKNEGTCTWGAGYSLTFESGHQMESPPSVVLDQVVTPGTEADISLSLVAPEESGTYQSNWVLQAPDGTMFGSRGDYPFYVQIIVTP